MVCKDQVHLVDFVVQFHTETVRHKVLHKVLPKESMRATLSYYDQHWNNFDDDGRYKQPEEDGPCWRLEGGALLKLDSQGPSFVGTTPGHDHVDGGGDDDGGGDNVDLEIAYCFV